MKTHAILHFIFGTILTGSLTLASQTSAQQTNQLTINQAKPTTMNSQPAQTVKNFLTAVQKGDNQTLAALIHPDIQWNQPGTNRFSGQKTSSAAVFHMVGDMFAATANTLSLADIKQITVNGNKVACLVRWKAAQPGGGVLDVNNIDVYTVENGKIVEATVYSEDIAQEDGFWGK
ncbi:nuclear transport factor 2 family protein [Spirosoma sp.]|uniref:nuclear transport factor 2 family protein n=1 Tax=Spirosoma sp. TaxID=1899569 RepID=UPI003B3B0F7E